MTTSPSLFDDLQLTPEEGRTFDLLRENYIKAEAALKATQHPKAVVAGLFSLLCVAISLQAGASPTHVATLGTLGMVAQFSGSKWDQHCVRQREQAVLQAQAAKAAYQAYAKKLSSYNG